MSSGEKWQDGLPTAKWTKAELIAEIGRLRERIHHLAGEAEERFKPLQRRIADIDRTSAYAARNFEPAGKKHWAYSSQIARAWTLDALLDRERAEEKADHYLIVIGQVEQLLATWWPSRERNAHQEAAEIAKAVSALLFDALPVVAGNPDKDGEK